MSTLAEVQLQSLKEAAHREPSSHATALRIEEVLQIVEPAFSNLEQAILEAISGPQTLEDASRHLLQAGGKRVRPLTTLLVTVACSGDPKKATPIAAATELVHAATLLHDDVMDEGEERRGRPAVRVLWGNLISVLSGDLLLTRALELVETAHIPGMMSDLLSTLQSLIAGEVAQFQARNREDLGMNGYLKIIEGKTASLFRFACRAGARIAHASPAHIEAAGAFGEHLGFAFQIVDDVLDLEGDPTHVGKRLGVDVVEGKTTLPLALALVEDAQTLGPLLPRARAGDLQAAQELATSQAMRHGCKLARAYALDRTEEALVELEKLPSSRARQMLGSIVQKLAHRKA